MHRLTTFFLIFIFAVILGSGCATAHRGSDHGSAPDSTMGPPEPYGPSSPPAEAAGPPEEYGPEFIAKKPIVLVLGPGQAHAFAYIGVIRALQDAKIPVAAIVASEMGAWVGGLYGMSHSINQFEWALLKFKEDDFAPKTPLLSGILKKTQDHPNDGNDLSDHLKEVVQDEDLKNARVPVYVRVSFPDQKESKLLNEGRAVELIRAATAAPCVMESGSVQGQKAEAPNDVTAFDVTQARGLGLGPVVVIDVISPTAPVVTSATTATEKKVGARLRALDAAASSEVQSADLVIRPQMTPFSYLDFQHRTEMIFRGKQAVQKELEKLKQLTGGAGK